VISNADLEQVRSLLDQLKNDDPDVRLQAAQGLRQVALRSRPQPSVRTRGSLSRPAPALVPEAEQGRIAEGAWDANRLVRGEMALAVGDYCDEIPLDDLIRLARFDSDRGVREAVADALTMIGGSKAAKALAEIVRDDPHPGPVSHAASGLEALRQVSEESGASGVRSRGAIRTRGALAGATRREDTEALEAVQDLDELRHHHPDPTVRSAVEGSTGSERPI
jgi:HEAT repeat protein